MAIKTLFTCQTCSHQTNKWIGKCPQCQSWNSFTEEQVERKPQGLKRKIEGLAQKPTSITLEEKTFHRVATDIGEVDRVLSGGLVAGQLLLLSGEPGIGKSTLTLQLCDKLAAKFNKVLYISGEESTQQISLRAKRLKIMPENLQLLNETKLENILTTLEVEKPGLVIIDSIQVLNLEAAEGSAGSISQVRLCTEGLMRFAKTTQTPVILIGHVTKEGNLAGPKVLEHLVDTVLHLEGDRYHEFRVLRSLKNRFGSTNEVGIFSMEENGLNEVKNPSASFLSGRQENSIGSCITCLIEGSRPLLVEIQALTNLTTFGYPRRTASGFDVNRLQLLIAVLQKHAGLNLSNQDVYINVIGGLTIDEPAADLAICLSIISSFKKTPLPADLVAIGEVGLSGEIRQVPQMERRIKEAEKMGLKKVSTEKIKTIGEYIEKLLK